MEPAPFPTAEVGPGRGLYHSHSHTAVRAPQAPHRRATHTPSHSSAPLQALLEGAEGVSLQPPHCAGPRSDESITSPMSMAMGRDQLGPCGCSTLPQCMATWLAHHCHDWQRSYMLPDATATCHHWCSPSASQGVTDTANVAGQPLPCQVPLCCGELCQRVNSEGMNFGHILSCFGSHCSLS